MNTVNNSNLNFNNSRAFSHDSRNFSFISFAVFFFTSWLFRGKALARRSIHGNPTGCCSCHMWHKPPTHCCCNKSCITNVAFPFIYMYIAYRLPINLFMEYETILLDWLLEIPLITWRDDWMHIETYNCYMIMILSRYASEFKNKKQMKTQRECKRSQGSFLIKQRTRSAPSFDWVSGLVGTG